jgi:arabinofuranan 3-O-arabinosyltransferase
MLCGMRLQALLNWRPDDPGKFVLAMALGLSLGYVGALAGTFYSHIWILDTRGHPVVEDFVAFWTAGHQALKGAAVAAYNVPVEHAAEVATIGHPFGGTLGWSYPPVFLFVAVLLASLPYTSAFLLWGAVSLTAYASVIAVIAKRPVAFLVACAAPWVLTALMPGQNGFLTAALVGAALVCLEDRPALAGILLGLLSYKPQFGILFPLVLAAGGYWRTFAWACISSIAINLLAGAVFGFDTFGAFLHALSSATQSHLAHAGVGWNKLQSAYGLLRSTGMPGGSAWAIQMTFSAMVAAAVVAYWRGKAPFDLKAAVLACVIPLVTPYVFVYDLPVLAVACAFLFRHRNFDRTELWLLASTAPCIFAFLWIPVPSAFFATLAVAAISARRVFGEGIVIPQMFRARQAYLTRHS